MITKPPASCGCYCSACRAYLIVVGNPFGAVGIKRGSLSMTKESDLMSDPVHNGMWFRIFAINSR